MPEPPKSLSPVGGTKDPEYKTAEEKMQRTEQNQMKFQARSLRETTGLWGIAIQIWNTIAKVLSNKQVEIDPDEAKAALEKLNHATVMSEKEAEHLFYHACSRGNQSFESQWQQVKRTVHCIPDFLAKLLDALQAIESIPASGRVAIRKRKILNEISRLCEEVSNYAIKNFSKDLHHRAIEELDFWMQVKQAMREGEQRDLVSLKIVELHDHAYERVRR